MMRCPIIWRDVSSWHPQLSSILDDLLNVGAVHRLRLLPSDDFYDDDMEWCSSVLREFSNDEETFFYCLKPALETHSLRTFHGTRTGNARSYLNEGIRLHDRTKLEQHIRSLVSNHQTLHGLTEHLDDLFEKSENFTDQGRCFVIVDDRVLIEECGQYLLGGSEFIQGIIGSELARIVLEDAVPTIIEIDLPLVSVPSTQLRAFVRKLVGEWLRLLHRPRAAPRPLDFSFCLSEPVPPEWIVGHKHPSVVNDPNNGRRPVTLQQTTCPAC